MTTTTSVASPQRYLAHVRRKEDGSFEIHDLEEHVRAVADLGGRVWRRRMGKLAELERKLGTHDEQIEAIFEAIRQLMNQPASPGRRIGFEMKSSATGKPEGHRK